MNVKLEDIRIYAEMLRRFNAPWADEQYNKACQDVGNKLLEMIDDGKNSE